jgi:hypothetical protein
MLINTGNFKYMKDSLLLDRRGQIVPLILLIVLVGATIGFSIAGTTIRNIQQTSLNEESNRAYSAAEAGLEEKLLELEQSGVPVAQLTPSQLQSGAYIKQVLVEQAQSLEINLLAKDDVAQVNLECPTCPSGNVTVIWDQDAALVITKISEYAEPYTVVRYAKNCGFSGNGFDNVAPSGGRCSFVVPVDGNTGSGKDRLMRIRAMQQDTYLSITPSANGVIPVQSTTLTSTGLSGETERTVQVKRSEPVAPSVLDYVLFSSQGSLIK